ANCLGSVPDPAVNSLTNPPGSVGGELVALGVVEFLDRSDKTQIAFLDEIKEVEFAAVEPFGNRHDQPQIGRHHLLIGGGSVGLNPLECPAFTPGLILPKAEHVFRVHAGFDTFGDFDFLSGAEQRILADLFEVDTEEVVSICDTAYKCLWFVVCILYEYNLHRGWLLISAALSGEVRGEQRWWNEVLECRTDGQCRLRRRAAAGSLRLRNRCFRNLPPHEFPQL